MAKKESFFKKRSRDSQMLAVSGPRNCTILAISDPSRNHQNGSVSGAINRQELAISAAINSHKGSYLFVGHKLPKWSSLFSEI